MLLHFVILQIFSDMLQCRMERLPENIEKCFFLNVEFRFLFVSPPVQTNSLISFQDVLKIIISVLIQRVCFWCKVKMNRYIHHWTCFSFLKSSVRFKTSVRKGLFWGTLPLNLCTRFIMIIGYVSGIQFKITIGRKTLFLSGQVIKVTVFL